MQNASRPEATASNPSHAEPSPQPVPHHEKPQVPVREIGGPPGPEPTRYGDWEKNGRCIDF